MEYFTLDILQMLIKTFVITFVLTDLFSFVGELISNIQFKIHKSKSLFTIVNTFKLLIGYMLSCSKCAAFWFALIFTGDLFLAAITSLVVGSLKELQERMTTKL